MSLSPDDIVGHRFKQALRGYAIDEVDDLLDRLADQVERTDAQLSDLRARVTQAEEQAATARRIEESLQRALVTAQETAERVVAEAEAEATTRREQAEQDAERTLADARRQADELLADAESAAAREATAARSRVDEAARRQREVLADITRQRDALRGHLRELDALVDAGVEVPASTGAAGLVGGELSDDDSEAPRDEGGSVDAPFPPKPTPRAADSLTVRVRDGASEAGAPLGSEPHGGS